MSVGPGWHCGSEFGTREEGKARGKLGTVRRSFDGAADAAISPRSRSSVLYHSNGAARRALHKPTPIARPTAQWNRCATEVKAAQRRRRPQRRTRRRSSCRASGALWERNSPRAARVSHAVPSPTAHAGATNQRPKLARARPSAGCGTPRGLEAASALVRAPRARNREVFTVPWGQPSMSATSSIERSSK